MESSEIIRAKLAAFLSANNATEKHIKALNAQHQYNNACNYLISCNHKKSLSGYIPAAFIWGETPDGWLFWNEIHESAIIFENEFNKKWKI